MSEQLLRDPNVAPTNEIIAVGLAAMTDMTIQHSNQNDLEDILALQKLAYQENAIRYNDAGIPPLTQTLDELIEDAKSRVILKAVVDGVIIGSVRAIEQNGYTLIERFIVHPDYQNQGIGRKLMAAIEQEFDTPVFRLFTGHLDDKNISLYSKLGYAVCGEEERISPNLALIHMEKRKDSLSLFLKESSYIDFSAANIQTKTAELFDGITDDTEKARIAFEFVRDEIPHSFDIGAEVITAKASDVLKHKTGICHAKANLLAALLRSQGIPTGFCFQHLTLMDDDSAGYCIHCYNAVRLDGCWVRLDARGNKPGVDARFSLDEPILAYQCRPQYDEYDFKGIYAAPHAPTMQTLDKAVSLQDVLDYIPEPVTVPPDIME